jgi:hypothetical protein
VALTAKPGTMAKLLEGRMTALENLCRQLRASTRCCKVCFGPTPEDSAVAASSLAELLAYLGKDSWSEFLPLARGSNDWLWHPSLAGGEWAPGKTTHAAGEAA